ncbi:hypothetical protein RQP46_009417 [Phenoliferia psychrophenolica]
MDLGIIASIYPGQNFIDTMGPRIKDSNQEGLVTSLLLLGAFFACPSAGWFADRSGRRIAIIVGCIIFLFGGSLQTGAQNINMVRPSRRDFLTALTDTSTTDPDDAPLYQSEIAQSSIRGRLTTLQQFFLGIGSLVASWVGYGAFKNYSDRTQWSLPLGLQLLPAVPLALGIMLFPESPRWLSMKGRDDEALAALARLHAHGDTKDPLVIFEMEDIKASMTAESIDANPWVELFTKKKNFRPLLLGIILQFSVQMTALGFTSVQTLRFQSYNSVIALFGEAMTILFVDRLGRRWPLIIGNIMSGITFACGAAIYAIYPGSVNNVHAHYAFIVSTTCFQLVTVPIADGELQMMTWVFNLFFSACIG